MTLEEVEREREPDKEGLEDRLGEEAGGLCTEENEGGEDIEAARYLEEEGKGEGDGLLVL